MPESIINKQTEENIKNYLGNTGKRGASRDVEDIFPESPKKNRNTKKIAAIVAFIFFVGLIALAYYSYNKGQNSFDEKQVVVSMKSSGEISSGEELSMEINYENLNEVDLAGANIDLSIPPGFVLGSSDPGSAEKKSVLSWNLGKVSEQGSGKIKLFGKLIGKKDSEHKFVLEMTYKPSNINYEYRSRAEASVRITSIPFDFSVKSKESINSGDEIEYAMQYKNVSARKFSAIKIKALLPDGFEYKTSEPGTSEIKGNTLIWDINNIDANSEGNIVIKGNLKGEKDEEKKIEALLSVSENNVMFDYGSAEASVKIGEIPIVISQTVNGESNYSANKNSELEYKIKFKNISDAEIKGLIINGELQGNVDLASMSVKLGSFDGKSKITWSAFNVPKLAALGAGEEDEVSFKVKVNDIFKIGNSGDKNFMIRNTVSIKNFNFNSGSSEIGKTIATNMSEVKIKAFPVLKQTAFFNDDQRIPNSGLIPPEAGEETTYTVHWNLSNLFNDVSNVKVSTVLPVKARWTGNYIASDGKISLGDGSNGSSSAQSIDPETISAINGGLLENRLGVSYSWYDNTVHININEKAVGLPAGFVVGDELEFSYGDGAMNEKGKCIITENEQYKGHDYFCQVPWNAALPYYGEASRYRISRAMSKIEKEDFYYDPTTREVVWVIPKIEANMGISSPAKEVVFQVGVTPEAADTGNTIMVVDKVTVSGYDDFTLSGISNVEGEIASDLPDDDSIGLEEGVVAAVDGSLDVVDGPAPLAE
ncbi:MAG: hypothetical protein WC788_04740 [Candidatus Paceibacterota bacterium]|jgi:hypothetical protein